MKRTHLILFSLLTLGFFSFGALVRGATIDELKQKIDERNAIIKQLEAEIGSYTDKINVTSGEAKTLQGDLSILNNSITKLQKQVAVTENKIVRTNLTIEELGKNITQKSSTIDTRTIILGSSIREMNGYESNSLVESLFIYDSLSELWNQIETQSRFQNTLKNTIVELKDQKQDLQENKKEFGKEKKSLVAYQAELQDQKRAVEYTRKEKDTLLAITKNKESEYKKILDEKVASKKAFEKELFDFESELRIAIDPKLLPSSRPGVISWPLDSVSITQLFGKTVDAKKLYTSGTHNGVDFRASIGTRVKAVLSGVVQGTGNTDLFPGCYSYGKWVLIKHANGLASLYGHLSEIRVSKDQQISTGDIVGYSGSTGYSTGPHLHFGLFASQGVQVLKYSSSINCKNAELPLAPLNAYLDPMAYFPN